MHGILLFAHGSRDPEWPRPFQAICRRVQSKRPECPIALAFLESMPPTLEEGIASLVDDGASAISVFPLFMAQGGHVREDLPRLLEQARAKWPHIPMGLEAPAGEVVEVLDAIAGWILARVD